jgi:ribosomal protein S18 acetylase RimI-like enzyme
MRIDDRHQPPKGVRIRAGRRGDLDAVVELEARVFPGDRLSRRSFRRLMASASADVLVADRDGILAGYAVILFRPRALAARLYSLAVKPEEAGRGVGSALLAVAEQAAIARKRFVMRMEVRADNAAAIARYRKAGYRERGRAEDYYEDGHPALRFERELALSRPPAMLA